MPHGRVEIGADREFDFFALAIVVGTVGLFVMGVFSKNRSARSEHPNICVTNLPLMFGCSELQAGIEPMRL